MVIIKPWIILHNLTSISLNASFTQKEWSQKEIIIRQNARNEAIIIFKINLFY